MGKTERVKIGILGCGNISRTYISNINELFHDKLEVVACADLNLEAANIAVQKCQGSIVCIFDEMLGNPHVEIVLNLTNSWMHFETNLKVLTAGKHVYCEKTLTLDREQANILVETAKANNLLLGCAPDTFMGAGMQTIRSMIENGVCGKISYVNTFIGMNLNHPMYGMKKHGGILFDLGSYYITALVNLFGPVKRVSGFAKKVSNTKTFENQEYELEIPSTTTSILEFENNVLANFTACNDTIQYLPKFEIYGTEGNVIANDPNHFSGDLTLQLCGKELEAIVITHEYAENCRAIGLVDMACSLRNGGDFRANGGDFRANGGDFRANGTLACHIVDVLQSIWESNDTGKTVDIKYTCKQPSAMTKNGELRWTT